MPLPLIDLSVFIKPVPICEQSVSLSQMLRILLTENDDRLVVVNEHQQPLGVITLEPLLTSWLEAASTVPTDDSSAADETLVAPSQPIADAQPPAKPAEQRWELPIMEPVAALSIDFTLEMFWNYLQAQHWHSPWPHWVLVNPSGTFQGLIDRDHLWRFLGWQNLEHLADITHAASILNTAKPTLCYLHPPESQASLAKVLAMS
jgi:hypothetical protein